MSTKDTQESKRGPDRQVLEQVLVRAVADVGRELIAGVQQSVGLRKGREERNKKEIESGEQTGETERQRAKEAQSDEPTNRPDEPLRDETET